MMIELCIICLVLTSSTISAQTENPIVQIEDGKILGSQTITPSGKPFFRFHAIPFAQPPLGDLRFADPKPALKWNDTKNCTSKNVVCLQIREYYSELETEDCLVLNVYTPKLVENKTEANLAVMVYIYGGAFYKGNSTYEAYGPDFLIERDIVVVTINYRVGPFGFLSTVDEIIPGNFGLKDQQLALKWVQNNIHAFGGNHTKVTIFGNSAGAASVGYQIINDESSGLFRAAIMSSGTPLSSWSLQRNPKAIALLTAKYVNESKYLNSSQDILEFLRNVPALDLRNAALKVLQTDLYEFDQFLNGYFYAPVIDSHLANGFVKKHIYEAFESGNFSDVPLMIGIVSEETLSTIEVENFEQVLFKLYDSKKEILVNNFLYRDLDKEEKEKLGKIIHEAYAQKDGKFETDKHRGIKFFSDQALNNGGIKHAYLASNYTEVYLYQFSYDGLMGSYNGKLDGAGSVTHTEDVNYIWRRNLPTANNSKLDDFPESDLLTQNRLLTLYSNFAKYLNPTPNETETLQGIIWPPLELYDSGRIYLDIDTNLTLKTDLKGETFNKWNEIYLKYAVRPYDHF